MHRRNPSMPKSKLSELSSVEWETSNSSCSDWLHSTHDIVLANRENPLTRYWLEKCSALHGLLQRAASVISARCVCLCTALRETPHFGGVEMAEPFVMAASMENGATGCPCLHSAAGMDTRPFSAVWSCASVQAVGRMWLYGLSAASSSPSPHRWSICGQGI